MTRVRSVAWVPPAPVLVPVVAGGSVEETDGLRQAAVVAVGRVVSDSPSEVVVVGPSLDGRSVATRVDRLGDAVWSWHGFGVGDQPANGWLPWPLGLGAWLLDTAGWTGPTWFVPVADPADRHGWVEAGGGAGVGLIVLGDGSARRSERAPGHLDDRAAGWDGALESSLAAGDPAPLAALDAELGAELMSTAAVTFPPAAGLLGDGPWRAEVLYADAPYGVGYIVAAWSR